MKILLTGIDEFLGKSINKVFPDHDIIGTTHSKESGHMSLDITSEKKVEEVFIKA